MLRRHRLECWTASHVGLATATDDALTVWVSEHGAVAISTDREFGRRGSSGGCALLVSSRRRRGCGDAGQVNVAGVVHRPVGLIIAPLPIMEGASFVLFVNGYVNIAVGRARSRCCRAARSQQHRGSRPDCAGQDANRPRVAPSPPRAQAGLTSSCLMLHTPPRRALPDSNSAGAGGVFLCRQPASTSMLNGESGCASGPYPLVMEDQPEPRPANPTVCAVQIKVLSALPVICAPIHSIRRCCQGPW